MSNFIKIGKLILGTDNRRTSFPKLLFLDSSFKMNNFHEKLITGLQISTGHIFKISRIIYLELIKYCVHSYCTEMSRIV